MTPSSKLLKLKPFSMEKGTSEKFLVILLMGIFSCFTGVFAQYPRLTIDALGNYWHISKKGVQKLNSQGKILRHYSNAVSYTHLDVYKRQEQSSLLYKALHTNYMNASDLQLNGKQRNLFLGNMLNYYSFHIGSFSEILSLPVLKQVFED